MPFLLQIAQVGPIVPPDTGAGSTPYYTGQASGGNLVSLIISVVFLLIVAGVGLAIFYLITRRMKMADRDKKSLDYTFLVVRAPKSSETETKVAEQLFSSLTGMGGVKGFWNKFVKSREGISFEIIAYQEYIGFFIYMPKKWAKTVENQIMGVYQNAEVVEVPEPNIYAEGSFVAGATFELKEDSYCPLKTYESYEGQSDPLTSILSVFAGLKKGEGGAIQVMITPSASNWQKSGQKYVQKVQTNNSDPEKPKISESEEKLQAINRKCSKIGFDVSIRLVTSAPSIDLAKMYLDNLIGSFSQFENPGINSLKAKKIEGKAIKPFMHDFIYRKFPTGGGMPLNVEELATIYHLPNNEVDVPHIDWLLAKKAPPPQDLPEGGLWLGTSVFRGQKKDIYMTIKDRRRHTYIVGQTGSGKSYQMLNMAMQDIYAGNGIAFMDPHGSTVAEMIRRIPPERAEDVIYFNPADTERPLGMNIIHFTSEQEKYMVVNSFLGLMHKMFDPNDQGIVGPRFERAVRNAMLTVMSEPGNTLVEVLRAIVDENYAKTFLDKITDEEVIRYWTVEMANTDKFHKSEILGWITSKFDRFVTNELVRNIIGQSEISFDFREAMDNKKIILINLAKGLIGPENAQFLGLVIVPMILRAALSREDIPNEDDREDFFLYVDEFQNFATEEFAQILSEARKYRLNLIVGHQYINQLLDQVRDAVFGNAGTIISFRVGAQDAEYLEREFAPTFTQEDLINVENINAFIKTLVNGVRVPPFSMNTFFNINERYPKNERVEQLVKQLSRMRYGRDVKVVEESIKARADGALSKGTAQPDGVGGGFKGM